jgi:hypothetical protein
MLLFLVAYDGAVPFKTTLNSSVTHYQATEGNSSPLLCHKSVSQSVSK